MDPNEALRVIRAACHELAKLDDGSEDPQLELEGLLIQSVRDLDEWLSKGGFVPDAWNAYRQARGVDQHGDPLGPPNPAHGELPEDVRTAVEDALDYRMGEASGLDDPDLDPTDREYALRYRRLLGK